MRKRTTYVGIDSAKKHNDVAMLLPDKQEPLAFRATNDKRGTNRLIRRLKKEAPGEVVACYEAGPCGYELQRKLEAAGIRCLVVAPSLVPVKPGDRIKTNRRDAKKLARYLRSGELTEVHPPTEEEEAVRDLCRCREAARDDQTRARHRMSKLLLRKGVHYPGRAWTKKHGVWLRGLKFEEAALQVVFEDYLRQLEHLEERLKGLEAQLDQVSKTEPYMEPVAWLRCFRGIDTVTAMTIVAELHDFRRFVSPTDLMSYLGLVPSEDSTGDRQKRGAITKAGNKHVRRVLVEASWTYTRRPSVGVGLRMRRKDQPGWVIAIADRAQDRLYRRYWKLVTHGKEHNKAVIAVARELIGFVWAALYKGQAMATGCRPAEEASG
jgi:transposase